MDFFVMFIALEYAICILWTARIFIQDIFLASSENVLRPLKIRSMNEYQVTLVQQQCRMSPERLKNTCNFT